METNELKLNNYSKDEPYIGMPIEGLFMGRLDEETMPGCLCSQVDSCPLAMTYVPCQRWGKTYEPEMALNRGTIFPALDLPFLGGGAR